MVGPPESPKVSVVSKTPSVPYTRQANITKTITIYTAVCQLCSYVLFNHAESTLSQALPLC